MFWAEKIAREVEERYKGRIASGEEIVVRDEKTASGRVHVGSLRSAALHGMVADMLKSHGVTTTFYFEINDFDPMDGIPGYLDEKEYQKYMGVQLYKIPSPEPGYENFAECYGQEYAKVLEDIGFAPKVYRASELYLSGKMNDLILKALERRDIIRDIYREVSKSEKGDDWYPINVVCEKCGKVSTTRVTDFDGEMVGYTCASGVVKWADGCGHEGRVSPLNGNAKFPWKVEWAAKFTVMGVHFEGGGKDHYSKGGAREVSEAIAERVFDCKPPYGVFNEFFLVGGKKMASSKGNAATAKELAELLPRHILRLLLIRTPINRQIDFDPDGDAIPVLYDAYDRVAEHYWNGDEGDDREFFLFAHTLEEREQLKQRFLPRFSQIAFLVQMPHMNVEEEVAKMKDSPLTDADRKEIELRSEYARRWLEGYADERFIFKLQESLPAEADQLTDAQKSAMDLFADKLESRKEYDGQSIHELTHEVKEESGLSPKEFFSAIYAAFLGKDHGPKVGWFLSTLDKEFVLERLRLEA